MCTNLQTDISVYKMIAMFLHTVSIQILQERSYRKQITQYVEGIYRPKYYTMTLKSRLRIIQGHSKRNHSSSRMRFMSHNWSATKQRLHPQSVAEMDRIRQCETSSGSRHKDTDQCLSVAISFCRHRSVPVPCENGSALDRSYTTYY